MPRHQGKYKPGNSAPYELSRTAIEKMVRCEACFWLEKVKGVKTPGLPGFNLNTNTDTLLKKDFDAVRGREPHALMKAAAPTSAAYPSGVVSIASTCVGEILTPRLANC